MDEFARAFRAILEYAQANLANISPAVKAQLAEFIRRGSAFIESQRIRGIPEPPEAPQIPLGADLLWILAGGQPDAFINYLRTIPDPHLRVFARNRAAVQQVIEQLQQTLPQGAPTTEAGIEQAPLKSSNIWGFHYNPKVGHLLVRFQNGSIYAYEGVPPQVFNAFAKGAIPAKTDGQNAYGKWWVGKTPSLGASFYELIRDNFPYQQVA